MAALQGANVPGADTRCLNEGVSSLSAFIRVAKPGDSDGSYFLDLNVPSTAFGVEPIDSLLTLFDEWKATTGIGDPGSEPFEVMVFPNPTGGNITFSIKGVERPETLTLLLFDSVGKLVSEQRFESHRLEIARKNLKTGVLIYELLQNGEALKKGSVVITN